MHTVNKDKKQFEENQQAMMAVVREWHKDLCVVMDMPEGRRVIWEIMSQCAPMRDVFTGNSATFYYLGQQAIGKWLYDMLDTYCFDSYVKARQENINRQKVVASALNGGGTNE